MNEIQTVPKLERQIAVGGRREEPEMLMNLMKNLHAS